MSLNKERERKKENPEERERINAEIRKKETKGERKKERNRKRGFKGKKSPYSFFLREDRKKIEKKV